MRVCSVCKHSQRKNIDRLILTGTISNRAMARQFGVGRDAIARHRSHITTALTKAHEAKEVAKADTLLSDVRDAETRGERLYDAADQIFRRALQSQDLKTALQAIKAGVDVLGEARNYMALRGQLTGELDQRSKQPDQPPGINVGQAIIVPTLADFQQLAQAPQSARADVRPAALVEGRDPTQICPDENALTNASTGSSPTKDESTS